MLSFLFFQELSVLMGKGKLPSDQGAGPDVDIRILENGFEPCLKHFLRCTFLQHYLQEPSASRSADHSPVDQVIYGIEYLIQKRVGGTGINLLAQFPVFAE